jgi:hypothetical protein
MYTNLRQIVVNRNSHFGSVGFDLMAILSLLLHIVFFVVALRN